MSRVTMRDALRIYSKQPLLIRWFVRLRHCLSPLEALESLVPKEGMIMDLGCGHGLFTSYMALREPSRSLLGVDPSPAKIEAAKITESVVPNARYQLGSIENVPEQNRFDAITIVDVLYLLPEIEQMKILKVCHHFLNDTGVLVLKTQDTRPRWRYLWTRAEESVMINLRLTQGSGIHFIPAEKTLEMLDETGFTAIQHKLPSRILYNNIVFIGRKKENKN
jgi:2-polyprenyl-3-methyl-5-hydroxy-6-metoxy-1,4-benzoquinol methylase